MTDIRSRLADALQGRWQDLTMIPDWNNTLVRLVDVLLSLPGIAIVDSNAITALLNGIDRDHQNCLEDAADHESPDEGAFYSGQAEGYRLVAERIRAQLLAAAVQAQEEQ